MTTVVHGAHPRRWTSGNPNKNALPPSITEAIKPVFTTLADDSLLEKCLHGGTQNMNKPFHDLIWECCPKTTFCRRSQVELALDDATVVFNNVELRRGDIFQELKRQVYLQLSASLLWTAPKPTECVPWEGNRRRNRDSNKCWAMSYLAGIQRSFTCQGLMNR